MLNQSELCEYLQDFSNQTEVLLCFPVNATNTEGGILNGVGPFDVSIQVLIIQIMLIQFLVQILAFPFKFLRQPKVMAEIIAGILLGPTALGRIPGFTDSLFNDQAMYVLNTVSSLGLIFFLFMMGLELDLSLLRRSIFTTSAIAIVGMVLPFGLGVAVSAFMYSQFVNPAEVSFVAFFLFIGVATAITAFPVLARILTELHLLNDKVGLATLGAAAINDVCAWLLLALCIAVAAAGNPLNILYIFLLLLGFCLIMALIVRPLLSLGVKFLVSHNNTLSQSGVVVTLMICLGAAWFTSLIGVHAIFGAFVAGMIVPRRERFAVQLTEKMEDLISVVFLPLYFAYSGIRTDLTKINTGMAWLCLFILVAATSFGKIGGSIVAARVTGTESWRECLALGIFMNCKGLVELIILNIGLDAGVLNDITFAIMVMLALITTLATTPLALFVYPPGKRGEDDTQLEIIGESDVRPLLCATSHKHLPVQLGIIQLLINAQTEMTTLHQFRLLEITERQSSVLNAMLANEEKGMKDPMSREVIKFAKLNGLTVQNHFGTVDVEHLGQELLDVNERHQLNLILLPWPEPGDLKDFVSWRTCDDAVDYLFNHTLVDIALLIETSAIIATSNVKIVVFYRGSLDDRAALKLALKLALSPGTQVLLVEVLNRRLENDTPQPSIDLSGGPLNSQESGAPATPPPSPRSSTHSRHSFDFSGFRKEKEKEKREKPASRIKREDQIKRILGLLPVSSDASDDQILDEFKTLAIDFPQFFTFEQMYELEFTHGNFITKRGYQSKTLFICGRIGVHHDRSHDDPLASLLGGLCASVLRNGVDGSVLLVGSRNKRQEEHKESFVEKIEKIAGSSKKHDRSEIDSPKGGSTPRGRRASSKDHSASVGGLRTSAKDTSAGVGKLRTSAKDNKDVSTHNKATLSPPSSPRTSARRKMSQPSPRAHNKASSTTPRDITITVSDETTSS